MIVLAFVTGLLVVLGVAGWCADHWPTPDMRSVRRFRHRLRTLQRGRRR